MGSRIYPGKFTKYSVSNNYWIDVALGKVAGVEQINKFGENENSTKEVRLPVWNGGVLYPYSTVADITTVNQLIDDIPMRGAVIEVQGLDVNWMPVTQDVILNGLNTTTPVLLATPLIRIFRMKVNANVVAAQIVVSTSTGGGILFAEIPIGYNQTLMALYTIPAGKIGLLVSYYGDVLEDPVATKDPDATEFILWAADRANAVEFQAKHEKGVPKQSGGFQHYFTPYLKFTEKTDIKLTAQCSGKDGHVHAGFDVIIVDA